MSANAFLDTNIFIYSLDSRNPVKRNAAIELIRRESKAGTARISYQVAQEFIHVATRKFAVPMKPDDVRYYMELVLRPMWSVDSSPTLMNKAIDIHVRWSYSLYDALIIASALEAECAVIYTEDMAHGQIMDGVRIVDPFRQ